MSSNILGLTPAKIEGVSFVSERLIEFIKLAEGFRPVAELDLLATTPVWTVGYGETVGVHEGQKVTREEADSILRHSITYYERCVKALVKISLNQGQFDALVDFAYNEGVRQLENSTLLKKVNAKDWQGAAESFGDWVFSGGKRVKGLIARRAAEVRMFMEERPNV